MLLVHKRELFHQNFVCATSISFVASWSTHLKISPPGFERILDMDDGVDGIRPWLWAFGRACVYGVRSYHTMLAQHADVLPGVT